MTLMKSIRVFEHAEFSGEVKKQVGACVDSESREKNTK